jgi:hypothetical protein
MVSVLIQAGTTPHSYGKFIRPTFNGVRVIPRQKPRAFLVVTHNSVKDSKATVVDAHNFTDDMTCIGMFHRLNFAIMFQQCVNDQEPHLTALDWHTGASHRRMMSL